jgi:hypothetical protein
VFNQIPLWQDSKECAELAARGLTYRISVEGGSMKMELSQELASVLYQRFDTDNCIGEMMTVLDREGIKYIITGHDGTDEEEVRRLYHKWCEKEARLSLELALMWLRKQSL